MNSNTGLSQFNQLFNGFFLEIMEYTGNFMQDDTHLTSSLLKMFSLFEIRLICGDVDLDTVSLKCINCQKETGLKSKKWLQRIL